MAHVVDQLVIVQLTRGHVYREAERVALRVPFRALPAGLLEHPPPDWEDQRAVLGDRNEITRRDDAARAVPPADQGLDPDRAFRLQVEHGLIKQEQLVV